MKKTILMFVCALLFIQLSAQSFLTPSFSFSHKKTAYLTLVDGTEIQGTIKDIDRKKGLIEEIKIKDGNGKNKKYKPEEVKFMYLPPSGFDKLTKAMDFMGDAQKWNDDKLNQDFLNQGYIYFELSDVKVKKKTMKLLMQLLNPTFSKNVKVYHDPFAGETMSVGVAGVDVAGGNAKSYYIAKGSNAAFRLKKKDYDTEFKPMWGKCDALMAKYAKIKWSELVDHVLAFSACN